MAIHYRYSAKLHAHYTLVQIMVGQFITLSDTINDVDKRSFELGREIELSTLMENIRKYLLNAHFCHTLHF